MVQFALLGTWLMGKSWACVLDGQQRLRLYLLPKAEVVANFGIINEHDYLKAYLHKINLADSPI